MPKDINTVLSSNMFQSASPEAQDKYLVKYYPEFGKASPEARRAFIQKHAKKTEDTESFSYGVRKTLPSLKDLKETGQRFMESPTGTLKTVGSNIYQQQKEQFDKAMEMRPKDSEPYFKTLPRRIEGAGHLLASVVPIFGPMAAESGKDIGTGHAKRGAGEAVGAVGQVLAPGAVAKGLKAIPAAARGISRIAGIAPEVEVIEGVNIPRLASELRPKSIGGRAVEAAKKLGLNEKGFKEFAEKQNQAVKQVIKEVAQKTIKRKLPGLTDNPADALNRAAAQVESESRAMYQALDTTIDQIPGGGHVLIEGLTPVIRKVLNKFPISQAALPGGDVLMDARGIASKLIDSAESVTTPFQTAQELRSALLKAARRATDANTRRLLFEGVEEIDSSMEDTLRHSGSSDLANLWRQANKGWSKKYALNEVADAVSRAIKGSPAEIADTPPTMSAKPLANMLNELSYKIGKGQSVMERAFGADEAGQAHIMSIRRAVSLLEQAQKVKAGGGFGKMRLAAHSVMAAGGLMTGHVGYAGAAIAVELGAEQLSKAMTSLKGAKAVEKLLRAETAKDAALLKQTVLQAAAESDSGSYGKTFSW